MRTTLLLLPLLLTLLHAQNDVPNYQIVELNPSNFEERVGEKGFQKYVRFYSDRIASPYLDEIEQNMKKGKLQHLLKVYRINCRDYSDFCLAHNHFKVYPFIASYDITGKYTFNINENNEPASGDSRLLLQSQKKQRQVITSNINRRQNGLEWGSYLRYAIIGAMLLILSWGFFAVVRSIYNLGAVKKGSLKPKRYFTPTTNPIMIHKFPSSVSDGL